MGVKGKKVGATLLKTHSSLEKDVQFPHQKINFKTFLLVGSKLPRLYVCTSCDYTSHIMSNIPWHLAYICITSSYTIC